MYKQPKEIRLTDGSVAYIDLNTAPVSYSESTYLLQKRWKDVKTLGDKVLNPQKLIRNTGKVKIYIVKKYTKIKKLGILSECSTNQLKSLTPGNFNSIWQELALLDFGPVFNDLKDLNKYL